MRNIIVAAVSARNLRELEWSGERACKRGKCFHATESKVKMSLIWRRENVVIDMVYEYGESNE
jgi:hypothetical protein